MNGRLAAHLEAFFTERLAHERRASEHTVASYRDSFRLLLVFARDSLHKQPCDLDLEDLDAPLVLNFLHHLEAERGNSVRSRNVRLAAIHSFYRYAAFREPERSALIQRVLSIPVKRAEKRPVAYLTGDEVDCLLAAPDTTTRSGRRDHAILLLAVETGLRVSELVHLRRGDIHLGRGSHVRCLGKGRKERCTPLRKEVVKSFQDWLAERPGTATDPLFPGARGGLMTAYAVRYLLAKQVSTAARGCPSLAAKRVTPHVLRHTCAVSLLESGVDIAVIALWLGHESAETTRIYTHASLQLKEQALAKLQRRTIEKARYRPSDALLAFLESL